MSKNYINYQNYYKHRPDYQNYQMIYNSGRITIQKRHRRESKEPIIKKQVLKKFENLENKLLDYLAEFVKYTDSCKIQAPPKPVPSGKKGSRVAPPTPRVEKPAVNEKPNVEIKTEKIFPTNLEKKIIEIERKTKNIQKYNQMLEESFKKNQIESEEKDIIILDTRLKETIFKEVKKLEEILIEKRLEDQNINMKDIPEYEHCQVMLQECIEILGDAIKEEKEETPIIKPKPKETKIIKPKPKEMQMMIKPKPKIIKNNKLPLKMNQDMSDDEFFGQYNLDINDECSPKKVEEKIEEADPPKDSDTLENEEALDEVGPLKNIGGARLRDYEETEEECEESESEPRYIEHDKRKLYQIQKELSNLEQNNKRFLNVLKGLKNNIKIKNLEEEDIEKNEFAEEVFQMRQVTRNFEVSEKNVDKLIGNLKKHTRFYSF